MAKTILDKLWAAVVFTPHFLHIYRPTPTLFAYLSHFVTHFVPTIDGAVEILGLLINH